MILKNKLWLILGWMLLAALPTKAKVLWIADVDVMHLEKVFSDCGYEGERGYLRLDDFEYPKVFLKKFPVDYGKIGDEEKRNALFIKILAPLTLLLNEEIQRERGDIEKVKKLIDNKEKLGKKQVELLEQKAKKYDVFTRLKGDERYYFLADELLQRIDSVPPSIMIAAAAIDTNWGMARIVKEANSLYKMLVWHTNKGLKPIGEKEDDSYRYKQYDSIYDSMKDFALKINSHKDFEALRKVRYEVRLTGGYLRGNVLAPYVYGSSHLKNYAGLFDYTVAYYELMEIDKSVLADNMICNNIGKVYEH